MEPCSNWLKSNPQEPCLDVDNDHEVALEEKPSRQEEEEVTEEATEEMTTIVEEDAKEEEKEASSGGFSLDKLDECDDIDFLNKIVSIIFLN